MDIKRNRFNSIPQVISTLGNLSIFIASGNKIRDISPLMHCKELNTIDLRHNNIQPKNVPAELPLKLVKLSRFYFHEGEGKEMIANNLNTKSVSTNIEKTQDNISSSRSNRKRKEPLQQLKLGKKYNKHQGDAEGSAKRLRMSKNKKSTKSYPRDRCQSLQRPNLKNHLETVQNETLKGNDETHHLFRASKSNIVAAPKAISNNKGAKNAINLSLSDNSLRKVPVPSQSSYNIANIKVNTSSLSTNEKYSNPDPTPFSNINKQIDLRSILPSSNKVCSNFEDSPFSNLNKQGDFKSILLNCKNICSKPTGTKPFSNVSKQSGLQSASLSSNNIFSKPAGTTPFSKSTDATPFSTHINHKSASEDTTCNLKSPSIFGNTFFSDYGKTSEKKKP